MPFNFLQYSTAFQIPKLLTGLSAWIGHAPFAFALMEMMRPSTFVELGTHAGDSYCIFCQAVDALKLQTTCTAVDTWIGDEHTGRYGEEIYQRLRQYHDPLYGRFSRLLRSAFEAAAEQFADGSVDLLHLDGLHSYEAVRRDLETWLPKMSASGVILLHDTAERQRDFGVWKLWEEVCARYPNFAFVHAHGLGVLGVGSNVREPVLRFLREANEDTEYVRTAFGRLGEGVTNLQTVLHTMHGAAQLQAIIDEWKRHTGQVDVGQVDVGPQTAQPLHLPAVFNSTLIKQVRMMARENLRWRRGGAQ
jgi:hypothetical protein